MDDLPRTGCAESGTAAPRWRATGGVHGRPRAGTLPACRAHAQRAPRRPASSSRLCPAATPCSCLPRRRRRPPARPARSGARPRAGLPEGDGDRLAARRGDRPARRVHLLNPPVPAVSPAPGALARFVALSGTSNGVSLVRPALIARTGHAARGPIAARPRPAAPRTPVSYAKSTVSVVPRRGSPSPGRGAASTPGAPAAGSAHTSPAARRPRTPRRPWSGPATPHAGRRSITTIRTGRTAVRAPRIGRELDDRARRPGERWPDDRAAAGRRWPVASGAACAPAAPLDAGRAVRSPSVARSRPPTGPASRPVGRRLRRGPAL